MQETVIAKYHDGSQWKALVIVIKKEKPGEFDAIAAIKAAAAEFSGTRRGAAVIKDLDGDFNYGDFVNNVPDAICKKHGFTVRDAFVTGLVVDHDDRLVEA